MIDLRAFQIFEEMRKNQLCRILRFLGIPKKAKADPQYEMCIALEKHRHCLRFMAVHVSVHDLFVAELPIFRKW